MDRPKQKYEAIDEYVSETEEEREKNFLQFIINYINNRIEEEMPNSI
jgi:hypothetical protein